MAEKIEISPDAGELLKAKEKAFNELTEISSKYLGNPFVITQGMFKVFEDLYNSGYQSGYRDSELNNILKRGVE